jgi:hypothetical protein
MELPTTANTKKRHRSGCSSVVEFLPIKHEALDLVLSTVKKHSTCYFLPTNTLPPIVGGTRSICVNFLPTTITTKKGHCLSSTPLNMLLK